MPEAPTEYYTSRYSGEEIDRGVAGGLTMGGAETSQEALYNLGAGVRPNLFDNPWLTINQKGETFYDKSAGQGYTVDRWWALFSTYDVPTKTLTAKGSTQYPGLFRQGVGDAKILAGKTVTLSFVVESGTGEVSFVKASGMNAGMTTIKTVSFSTPGLYTLTADIPSDVGGSTNPYFLVGFSTPIGSKLQFNKNFPIKLEFGNTHTLAYQDSGGTWKLLPQPDTDNGTQLEKCQKHLFPIKTQGRYAGSVNSNGADGRFFIPTPVTIRTNPTIVDAVFTAFSGGSQVSLAQKISGATALPNGVEVFFSGVSGLQSNSIIVVYADTSGFLSAEL